MERDILRRDSMQAIVEQIEPNPVYIGEQFLPMKEEVSTRIIWDVVRPGHGIARIRAFDAEAHIVSGRGYEQKLATVTDWAEKVRYNITDLRALKEPGAAAAAPNSLLGSQRRHAENKITEDLAMLRARVEARLEWARMQALQGSLSYVDSTNNYKIEIDYGIPATQKDLAPANPWNAPASATPLQDLLGWKKVLADAGVTAGTVIMSTQALYYASQAVGLRSTLQYTSPMLTPGAFKQLVLAEVGLNVIVYDGIYWDSETSTTTSRFVPENKLIMLPNMNTMKGVHRFGDTKYVPHPVNNWTGSYYVWQDEKKDPYGLEVGVGLTALPVIYQPSAILTAVLW